jgi:LacI family transcriptional regulator
MARSGPRSVLLLLSTATRMSNEIERRIGFAQVVEDRFPALEVVRLTDLPSDDEDACDYLVHHVKAQVEASRVGGVYCVGGATAGTAKALALLGLTTEVPLVAHDLTSTHQTMLVDGALAFVLHQDVHYCVLTAARTLRGLCENIRGAPSVVQPRVEILTAENLH